MYHSGDSPPVATIARHHRNAPSYEELFVCACEDCTNKSISLAYRSDRFAA